MTASETPVRPSLMDQIASGHVFVVAEIGKNFIQIEEERPVEEYLANAKALARSAKDAGADAVKFQTHNVEDEIIPMSFDSPHFEGHERHKWVSRNTDATPSEEFWKPLRAYCDEIGVTFFSTPMSRGAAMKLEEIGVPFWKVASSDILDFPMLEFMVKTSKPICIPTGMHALADVDKSVAWLRSRGAKFILMHAISRYPYPAEDSNLLTIRFYQKRYPDLTIGFSQNSPWIEPAIAAVALGARAIEQHFTFDRAFFGPDHKVSMLPEEFKRMVEGIREVESDPARAEAVLKEPTMQKYMGEENKILQEGEKVFPPIFYKALMAGRDIPAGITISAEMIYSMRPRAYAGGLSPEEYENVLGKKAKKDLKKYDPITWDVIV